MFLTEPKSGMCYVASFQLKFPWAYFHHKYGMTYSNIPVAIVDIVMWS